SLWRTHSAHVDARRCAHTLSDDEALQLNRKLWGNDIVHGTQGTGENEWHTPFSFSVNLLSNWSTRVCSTVRRPSPAHRPTCRRVCFEAPYGPQSPAARVLG